MSINWKSFKKDQNFFLKYFAGQAVSSVAILGALMILGRQFSFTLNIEGWHLAIIPFAVILGVKLPALLHNAVHFNLRPRLLNDIVGEVIGFFVLFGLGPFRISHFLHHAFADTEWDTHPPEGKGFLWFMISTQINTITVIRRKFLQLHGNTLRSHTILFFEMMFYYVSLATRAAIWYLALGPELFLVLYLPAYITNVLVFAHINFATHATRDDGSTEILNLNHNTYYRFINWIGDGVYFHANHHSHPNLYNPMTEGAKYAATSN